MIILSPNCFWIFSQVFGESDKSWIEIAPNSMILGLSSAYRGKCTLDLMDIEFEGVEILVKHYGFKL